jgi:nucleoside-diphosphate-sugar epimerase
MRIFLAGASGVVGRRLVPLLVGNGHYVVGTTRTPSKTDAIRSLGAEPMVLDALDRAQVMRAVEVSHPDVVVHQLTALSTMKSMRKMDEELALTNRLRTEGTDHLLGAAQSAGARRFVAQSFIGFTNIREGGRVKTETDPLDPHPPGAAKKTLAAIRQLETMVTAAPHLTGIILRYGNFYGPGTAIAPGGAMWEMVRRRKFPIAGDGAGVWSFIHIDDVANATRLAIENGPAGIYNIVDDDPAEVSIWLPELARSLGAKQPLHLPAWLGGLIMGEAGMSWMTKARGSSNAKAKRELNWKARFSSWREGFRLLALQADESRPRNNREIAKVS